MPDHPNTSEKKLRELLVDSNFLTAKVEEAINIAKIAHGGKLRDTGTSYLNEHIYPIVESLFEVLSKNKRDDLIEKALVLGLIHDALEDAPDKISIDHIKNIFGDSIAESLNLLTKSPQNNVRHLPKDVKFKINNEQFRAILQSNKLELIFVKCADRYNNICCIKSKLDEKSRFYNFLSDTRKIYLVEETLRECPEYYWLIKERIELLEKLGEEYF